jgi:hypothetical protein
VLTLIREIDARDGIALTPHEIVIHRSFAAVDLVNAQVDDMQRRGDVQDVNRELKVRGQRTRSFGIKTTYIGVRSRC